ncbi:DUF2157 domain-containing protein [Piscibacillus halophilus]|uniref:Uncharacterized membrane protein n=1 Tax=Piscibacillus halophilus TaxID=571933 RepID=A0A1H9B0N4_9BACI|nr:DUF2157 domain-containing protein [Piscibacillus halophilus]SEP82576.1 Uncharacterized membrane protein [Piscibacillus halophilus]
MKQKWLRDESEQWVNEGIIRPEQRDAIMSRYKGRDRLSLIFFLSALLIGLSCLSFVAANWQVIPELIRMLIIILFMVGFYILGHVFEQRANPYYGMISYVVALSIFGAGIFLVGQMYHYTMNSVFAFIVWAIVAYLLYLSRPYFFIFLSGLAIVTVGAIYGLANMHAFDWWLFALFVIGYGSIVLIQNNRLISYFFAISYSIQLMGYTMDYLGSYYWFSVFGLLLYLFGLVVYKEQISIPFRRTPLVIMFGLLLIQTLIFEFSYRPEVHVVFCLILTVMLIIAIVMISRKNHLLKLSQLVIFLPIFLAGDLSQFLAYIVLYVFSVGMILDGYQSDHERRFHFGTGAFLLTTLTVYVQVAWGFLNQSLFFLLGGIILFFIGFLLERKRKTMTGQKRKGV